MVSTMRRLAPVAWFLMYTMVPGASEFIENAWHLATEGHLAHAIDDAEHHPEDEEHGCSGAFHFCSCHTTPSFLGAARVARVLEPLVVDVAAGEVPRPITDAHVFGVYRPPIG